MLDRIRAAMVQALTRPMRRAQAKPFVVLYDK
jgi:hypothetical protein